MRRKVVGQSSSTIQGKTQSSGISNIILPKVLAYPEFIGFDRYYQSVKNIFCYIIKHYGYDGLSVLIYRQPDKDQVVVLFGDWRGNNIDIVDDSLLSNAAKAFLEKYMSKFVSIMRTIKIDQMQLFFTMLDDDDLMLVDVQTSLNKFSGPGMIRDIFSKIFKTQEVVKIEILDDRSIEYIRDGAGSYGGDLVIKPSRFRMFNSEINNFSPLYVEVTRDA